MYIISDEILERLLCSECKKYLSVKPVNVYPNRSIKCGRCSKDSDTGVSSLFGILSENALFRCVNRYDGCSQLLTYSEVAEHEKLCIGKQYECTICCVSFWGTSYDIYVHVKQKHANAFLMNYPEFTIDIDYDIIIMTYLYCKNDLLFFINVHYYKSDQALILNALHLGSDQQSSRITQRFALYSFDRKMKYQTKAKSCCSASGSNLKSFQVRISENDFQKNVVICRFHLDTENVEQLIALPKKLEIGKSHAQLDLDTEPTENSENAFPQLTENWSPNPSVSHLRKKYPVRVKCGANFNTHPPFDEDPIFKDSPRHHRPLHYGFLLDYDVE